MQKSKGMLMSVVAFRALHANTLTHAARHRRGLAQTAPSAMVLAALLAATASHACSGDSGSPTQPPTLQGVRATFDRALIEPGDTVSVAVTGTYSDGSTRQVPGDEVSGASTNTSIAQVVAGPRIVGVGAGSTVVSLCVGSICAELTVDVPPAVVGAVTIEDGDTLHAVFVGGQWRLHWRGTTRAGRPLPLGLLPTFRSTDEATAAVDPTGTVVGRIPGVARVLAAGVASADTIVVRVLAAEGDLGLASGRPVHVEPGAEIVLRGSALASAVVSIDGTGVRATVEGDSIVHVSIPSLPRFDPCLPPSTAELAVDAGGRSFRTTVGAEAPVKVVANVGAHRYLGDLLARGCRVELGVGRHLLVPFAWERKSEDSGLPPDTTRLELIVGEAAPGVAATTVAGGRVARAVGVLDKHVMPRREELERAFRAYVATALRPAEATAVCAPPTTLGDSMIVLTERTPEGRYTWNYGVNPQRAEAWYLAYQNDVLSVILDSAAYRIFRTDPAAAAVLASVAEWYRTDAHPVFSAMYADPLPDDDQNGGRTIMFGPANSDVGGGGGTGYYSNLGCSPGWTTGEAFITSFDPWTAWATTPAYLRSYYVLAWVMHEAGHTQDGARRSHAYRSGAPTTGAPSNEASAIMSTDLWIRRYPSNAFEGRNQLAPIRELMGGQTVSPCWRIVPGTLAKTMPNYGGGWANGYGYDQACQGFQFFLGHALAGGRALPQIMTEMTLAARGTYQEMASAILGRALTGRDAMGTWLLSWYADDRVSGTAPELQNRIFDTPGSHVAQNVPFPLPDGHVTTSTARLQIVLGEPDGRFVLFNVSAPLRVAVVRGAGSLDPGVVDVAYLRVN